MPQSRLNPLNYREPLSFDINNYVVSLVNTDGKSASKLFSGHSAIIVEGVISSGPQMMNRQLFIGFYDIRAKTDKKNESKFPINKKGHIIKVSVKESNDYKRGKDYGAYKSFSESVPALKAKEMIASIKKDQKITSDADKGIGNYLLYQVVGVDSIFSEVGKGHNCTSWCAEKLEIAGIDIEHQKKPELAVRGSSKCCTIL